ncbi:MAG TPA: hypothetical protein PKN96_00720 [Flavobacterium sp.]|uniref:Cap15 family cyclic dinucleotide receptor domain-containing protein n=1 Tax=Flavobacterium sp. TaxID=239 RepID=UPI002BD6066C|nr:hypothetical protein [Flavobacterium sp.]HNP31793.1 hypothetical protein [Flavobacterium sp.]
MNLKYYKTGRLVAFLLILPILVNPLSKYLLALISKNALLSQINNYLDTFSTLGLITIIFLFINYFGWKCFVFKWLINIPNLNGRYEGILISSFENPDGTKMRKKCIMEIKQNASSIHIHSYFGDMESSENTSSSYSVSEHLSEDNDGIFKLYYIFTNETEMLQTQLNNHIGTSKFRYYEDIKTLKGDYYNQRKNNGTIEVVFQQKKLLGRL